VRGKRQCIMKKYKVAVFALLFASLPLFPAFDVFAEESGETDYGELTEFVKDKLRDGSLESEEDVRKAIEEAEEQTGLNISDQDADRVVKMMNTVNDLDIDQNQIADIVDDVYDKAIDGKSFDSAEDMLNAVENQLVDSAVDHVAENVKESFKISIKDYFNSLIERFTEFVHRIMERWLN